MNHVKDDGYASTLSTPGSALKIQDLPSGERPRERLLQHGAASLSNSELLAILLRTGVEGESALGVAQRLLTRLSGLRGLAVATYAEMAMQRGVSEAKYCQIKAALELGRRLASTSIDDRVVIRGAQDVASLVQSDMAHLEQEHLKVLLLSTKNHVLGIVQVYVGTVNTSVVRAAEVLRPAVRENCPAIIVVHNHPSGDPTPSPADVALTSRLVSAGKLMDIEMLDHVVIGNRSYVSMKESGLGFPH